MSVLLDTSVLTRLRVDSVRERVEELARARRAHVCSMTALEFGFSARTATEFDTISEQLRIFEIEPVTEHDFEQASRTQRALAELGQRGRKIPDLLIASVAQRRGLNVLHYDHDFDIIAMHTGQSTEWVVARGSID